VVPLPIAGAIRSIMSGGGYARGAHALWGSGDPILDEMGFS
jgi:hypothetical protein